MTGLLLWLFLKRRGKNDRVSYGLFAAGTGVVVNVLLFGFKLAAGLLSGSISIIADAVNNLSDSAASAVGLFGFLLARAPADKEHPYGHGRVEYISAMAVAVLILTVAFEVLKSSVQKILRPVLPSASAAVFAVLLGSILVKLWLFFFYRKIGRLSQSPALAAAAADSRNDVFVTLSALFSVTAAHFFGANVDGFAGLAVSVIIAVSGIKLLRETASPLLGEPPSEETAEDIRRRIAAYDGILGVHDLTLHNYGVGKYYATAHAEVSADCDLLSIHNTVDLAEREISKETGVLLTIHIDPMEIGNEKTQALLRLALEKASEICSGCSIHDFRAVIKPAHTDLLFDLCVPSGFKMSDARLQIELENKLKQEDSSLFCIINIDRTYG